MILKETRVLLLALYGSMQPVNAEPLAIETLGGAIKREFGDEVVVQLSVLNESLDLHEFITTLQQLEIHESDIVGLSVPQSTYRLANRVLYYTQTQDVKPLIVLGHALPTHEPELFLNQFPEVLIVRGWGEASLCQIIRQYRSGRVNPALVPNLIFKQDGKIQFSPLDWPRHPPSPMRYEPGRFFARVESSRGCHYDTCTFCTRPPRTSKIPKWFRFSVERVINQIEEIKSNGITDFTFTDEDFIGNDLKGAERIAQGLKKLGGMNYSLSLRVDNVYNPSESEKLDKQRHSLFHLLKESGLSLVFLGVESLSSSQLNRYGKGTEPLPSIRAVDRLINIGIPVELGFIFFDPLLTLGELKENMYGLAKTSYWKYIDQLFDHLRVQKDTACERMLKAHGLLGDFQPDIMSYDYSFQDPCIAEIARICLIWKEEIDPVYIQARNVQRTTFDKNPSRTFVCSLRLLQFEMLQSLIKSVEQTGSPQLDPLYYCRRLEFVKQLRKVLAKETLSLAENEVLVSAEAFLRLSG